MRVGIVVHGGDGWLGGRNYIRNLLTAVYNLPQREIDVVVLTTPESDDQISDLPPFEVVRSKLLTLKPMTEYARKAVTALLGRNLPMERLLRRHKISVLSHSGHLGSRASVPTVGWIPDFQHMHLPEFQKDAERAKRERRLMNICANCTRLVLSSECVRSDLKQFAPQYFGKAEILRFVAAPFAREPITSFGDLSRKYQIDGPFFLLPNQFWAHKNHKTVITALKLLRQQGKGITVIATGSTRDHRNPGFFDSLIAYAHECGVSEDFRVLGIVPYPDLAGLMRSAVALVNPSLFEGWSTSVEEAKTAGKAIVLSDIPVHREQNPERGIFFSALDAERLAAAMLIAQSQFDPESDMESQERAFADFPRRQQQFAREYQRIITSIAA
jgi:glycosyltransferase involved in cell wall biosynthesis